MDYLNNPNPDAEQKPKAPKIKLGPVQQSTPSDDNYAAVSSSHNTFRPDIYRTSEGYLN